MSMFFPTILDLTSGDFVIAALAVCLVTAASLVVCFESQKLIESLAWLTWSVAASLVGGVGVWTTHFIAMLGYRPDLPLTYGGGATLWSAIVSVLVVGVPLALSGLSKSRSSRMILGSLAGMGVWVVHNVGMLALDGCQQSHTAMADTLAVVLSAALMALSRYPTRGFAAVLTFVLCFFAAIGSAHWIALYGTSVIVISSEISSGYSRHVIAASTIAGTVVLLISLVCTVVVVMRVRERDRLNHQMLSTALNNMSNGLLFFDASGRLQLFNTQYLEIFRLGESDIQAGMTRDAIVEAVAKINGWSPRRKKVALERAELWMSRPSVSPIEFATDDGKVIKLEVRESSDGGLVLTYDDVSLEREARNAVAHMAFHDEATGLPNRRALKERLATCLSENGDFNLILLELQNLRQITDTYGHRFADKLIAEAAQRLSGLIEGQGLVTRMGGETLAVIDHATSDGRLKQFVANITQPFVLESVNVTLGCSIGICGRDSASSPDEMMQFADIALNDCKTAGGSTTRWYNQKSKDRIAARALLESDLRRALHSGEFHLAYQPVVATMTRTVIGYEALLRWTHPTNGPISPAEFIPVAEECGLMEEIGGWVIRTACLDAASLPDKFYVAVNISPIQFKSPGLFAEIVSAIDAASLNPSRLEVELTETAMVEDGPLIAETLGHLRKLGVRIAMDDFGTGYSSLAHLKDFPLDRIKIDRSFVNSAQTNSTSMAVLMGIIQIARDMGVETLAEGVETNEQLQIIENLGCDAIQGYLFGKPAPLSLDANASLPAAFAGSAVKAVIPDEGRRLRA